MLEQAKIDRLLRLIKMLTGKRNPIFFKKRSIQLLKQTSTSKI